MSGQLSIEKRDRIAARPLFWNDEGQRESKSQEQAKKKVAEVVPESAGMGRTESTSPTPIGESLKMVTKQLLQSPQATDMVSTDIRMPPKIKTQHLNAEEFVPIGKGEAIPLDADNIHSYQVVADTQYVKPSTAESTPASGISTWILLNGSEQSTQASQKKQPTKPLTVISTQVPPKKKLSKPSQEVIKTLPETLRNATSSKLENKQSATITKVDNPKKAQQSVNQEPLVKIPALMLQDAKFKNKTPVIVGKVPSSAVPTKNKSDTAPSFKKGNGTITPVTVGKVEALAPQSVRRKVSVTSSPATTPSTIQSVKPAFQYELVPTTSVVVHSDIVEADTTEEVGTTEITTTTTKRTRKPGNKKKKNKNRRRRPTKKPEGVVESKITEEGNSTRIAPGGSRPLSTRIYNYLSREIMPSVGVGLVGLVLTAGLAGLFLYPFGGGVAARRTYEKVSGPSPDGHMYYYNDYSSNGEVDNGQAEETIFGQVLAGMQQSENKYEKYPRPSTSTSGAAAVSTGTRYSTQSKYRYDPSHEYGYHSGYQGKDKYSSLSDVSTTVGRNPEGYSTLPDSASIASKYNPSYSIGTQYSAPSGSSVITQYGDPKYSSSASNGYSDSKYASSADSSSGIGSVQYDTKYSSPIDSTGNTDSSGAKYSTLTGLSVEPQSSKYTSMTDDQAVKYPQSPTYTSITEPKYTSMTDGQNTKYISVTDDQNPKYTSMTDNKKIKYTSMTDGQNPKYSSVNDDQSVKYPTSAEYTAYSNPSDIGTQSGTYSSSNHKQTGYSDIEYDETKSLPSLTEEDKSDKSQPTFSALHASDDTYSNVDSMSMFSGSYSNEVRHRQGVLAVEHGPRNMKLDRQKRQLDVKQNEVDGSLLEDSTTTEKSESTTDSSMTDKTTEKSKIEASPSHESTAESTTWSMPKEPESTTLTPPSRDHGFFGFLRRLAQMKLRMGLELLRSTTHAVARYLDSVQKRVETVVRDMDKKTARQRRDIFKKMI